MAAIYWPLLYFGFSRTFRERDFDVDRFFGGICVVGLALVGYMLDDAGARPPVRASGPGWAARRGRRELRSRVRRDFGFWSAFIVYPAIALLAIGRLVYERNRALTWIA